MDEYDFLVKCFESKTALYNKMRNSTTTKETEAFKWAEFEFENIIRNYLKMIKTHD